MQIRNGIAEAIGNTPLIKLKRASEQTSCTILGKAEFMNPGQSVKDRAALFIIEDAVRSGRLRPGGVIVEGTAGNTGIGRALVGNALGFRSVIVIPDTQSQEKKDTLRLCGAELVEVPAGPAFDPHHYAEVFVPLADPMAVALIFDLLEHEGLCLGGSSGINIAGAIRLARELGPGHTIVTVLTDYGTRYQTKLFNPEFLRSKELPVPSWLERRSTLKVPFETA